MKVFQYTSTEIHEYLRSFDNHIVYYVYNSSATESGGRYNIYRFHKEPSGDHAQFEFVLDKVASVDASIRILQDLNTDSQPSIMMLFPIYEIDPETGTDLCIQIDLQDDSSLIEFKLIYGEKYA